MESQKLKVKSEESLAHIIRDFDGLCGLSATRCSLVATDAGCAV